MKSQSKLDEVLHKIKKSGHRLTQTRKELVKFILSRKGHWTIQDLATDAIKKFPKIGIATVYRTVNLLQKNSYLTETTLGSSSSRYEITPHDHHDHLSCISCGKIVEFENEEIENLQESIARKYGFKLIDHRMELYGLCDKAVCRKKKEAE